MYVNPILNKPVKPRRTRSDKKQTVRIFVDEEQYKGIRFHSRLQKQSMSAYATKQLLRVLYIRDYFTIQTTYTKTKFEIDLRLDQESFRYLLTLATEHHFPIKEVAARIFNTCFLDLMPGGKDTWDCY